MASVYERDAARAQATVARAAGRVGLSTAQLVLAALPLATVLVGTVLAATAPPEEVANYFTNKRNLVNVVVVKRAWAWTTAAAAYYVARQPARAYAAAAGRYAAVTAWWVLFTQWCAGNPIMDRVFLATGGQCEGIHEAHATRVGARLTPSGYSHPLPSKACRRAGGAMTTGHDPSGHAFILTLLVVYLLWEMCRGGVDWRGMWRERRSGWRVVQRHAALPALVLTLLYLWMLLMTSMYFHLGLEKITGCVCAYAVVWLLK